MPAWQSPWVPPPSPGSGRAGRALTLAAVPVVGLTRIYVGAHLPLDVAGGAALGVVIDAVLSLVSGSPGQAAGRAASGGSNTTTAVCPGRRAA